MSTLFLVSTLLATALCLWEIWLLWSNDGSPWIMTPLVRSLFWLFSIPCVWLFYVLVLKHVE